MKDRLLMCNRHYRREKKIQYKISFMTYMQGSVVVISNKKALGNFN